jgi:prepilin peptidase CpaA
MVLDPGTALIFLPFVMPIAIWAAWSDLRFMRIPNMSVLALLSVFVVLGPFALPFDTYLWRYLHLAVVLAAGFVLTITGFVGAGDAKFLAAMAPFFAPADGLVVTQLFGVTLLSTLAAHRAARAVPTVRAAAPHWESWERSSDFPMGITLASVLVLYLVLALGLS